MDEFCNQLITNYSLECYMQRSNLNIHTKIGYLDKTRNHLKFSIEHTFDGRSFYEGEASLNLSTHKIKGTLTCKYSSISAERVIGYFYHYRKESKLVDLFMII